MNIGANSFLNNCDFNYDWKSLDLITLKIYRQMTTSLNGTDTYLFLSNEFRTQ